MHRSVAMARRSALSLLVAACLAWISAAAAAASLPALVRQADAQQAKATAYMAAEVVTAKVAGHQTVVHTMLYVVKKSNGFYAYSVSKDVILGHAITTYGYDTPTEVCTKSVGERTWVCSQIAGGAQRLLHSLGASTFTSVKYLGAKQVDGVGCQGVSGVATTTVDMGKPMTVVEHITYWIASATKLPVETITQSVIANQTSTTTIQFSGWNSATVASHIPSSVP